MFTELHAAEFAHAAEGFVRTNAWPNQNSNKMVGDACCAYGQVMRATLVDAYGGRMGNEVYETLMAWGEYDVEAVHEAARQFCQEIVNERSYKNYCDALDAAGEFTN